MYKLLSQVLGAVAVLVSLLLVAYELKRNNDIAVVQSQYELLSLKTIYGRCLRTRMCFAWC